MKISLDIEDSLNDAIEQEAEQRGIKKATLIRITLKEKFQ